MTSDARILRVQYKKHCNLTTLLKWGSSWTEGLKDLFSVQLVVYALQSTLLVNIVLYKHQLNNTQEEVLQVFAEDEQLWWHSTYMLAEKRLKCYASHQTARALSQQILLPCFPIFRVNFPLLLCRSLSKLYLCHTRLVPHSLEQLVLAFSRVGVHLEKTAAGLQRAIRVPPWGAICIGCETSVMHLPSTLHQRCNCIVWKSH